MRIRVVSVFEGVVYHCWPIDRSSPCRPQLEVEALLRPGDADADAGPLLLGVADYIAMVGDIDVARPCLEELAARGRIVERLGVDHIAFPTWTRVGEDGKGERGDPADHVAPADPAEQAARQDHPTSAPRRPDLGLINGGLDDPGGGAGGEAGGPR